MNNSTLNKASNVGKNVINKEDQNPSKLITFQSVFPRKDKGRFIFMKAPEKLIFEKLPIIRSLFDMKLSGDVKDTKDRICYNPEHANTEKPAIPRIPGKIVYMFDLVESKFENHRPGYEQIAKWNISTLWTLMECLLSFLEGRALKPSSKVGRSEKLWAIELAGVQSLATYLGNTDFKDKAVRSALVTYMRQDSATQPANPESSLDGQKETPKQAKASQVKKAMKREIIDLTEDNIPTPQSLKKKTQSTSISKKSKKGPQPADPPQKLKKETKSTPTRKNGSSMPKDVYIQLNEAYPRFLRVDIETAAKGSKFMGLLLRDLHAGNFATGEMSKVVGKSREGKPTLLWDEVLRYYRSPGNILDTMLSWGEDYRWAPLVMFVERCQVNRALWQDWSREDIARAKYFDTFVKAHVGASDVKMG